MGKHVALTGAACNSVTDEALLALALETAGCVDALCVRMARRVRLALILVYARSKAASACR